MVAAGSVAAAASSEVQRCELCGGSLRWFDPLLFGMEGEWSCAACKEAGVPLGFCEAMAESVQKCTTTRAVN